jgi:serine/threonine protein kinase
MHRFHVVHRDINLENIMWSPKRQRAVFADFGLSDWIAEEGGLKTFTVFHGTPNFVSKEMLKLFSIEVEHGFVDLYYNDLVGLQNIKSLWQSQGSQAKERIEVSCNDYDSPVLVDLDSALS